MQNNKRKTDPEESQAIVLTQEQVEALKDQLLDSIYRDIGKNVVKKFLWVAGAVGAAAIAWVNGWPRVPH
jgi:hypothetical protein